jgi:ADP-dependent NAD(P)H-hydrate dehydratase / NAD(P)H-hydrate epimerase
VRPVLTPTEMAEADRRTIAAGTPVEVLMERAGRAVAWTVRRVCGGTYGKRAVVVCGKGNNGGDGLVAARVLRGWGTQVDVFELKGGINQARFERALRRSDVVVDAMYGTGFKGALEADAARVTAVLESVPAYSVSVDIPSGIDGLTGEMSGEAFWADRTVCFAGLKSGLLFQPGRAHAGDVDVVDIGVDVGEPLVGVTEASDVARDLPRRAPEAHKWQSGVMVVGGSGGMTGAPLFASHAAMRAGAGIVWCCVPAEDTAAGASGSEVITRAMPATADGALDEAAATAVLKDVERFRCLVLGPGLGREEATAAAVRRIAAEAPVPLVLDADGLNCLARDLDLLRVRTAPTVLTPHAGEYERLTGAPVGPDRLAAARALAARARSIVLLKGSTTVVAEPDGRAAVNLTGGSWLATAGTGDVLSGIMGAFVAGSGAELGQVAAAAWVHGRAADHAGHTGLVAGDLIDALPRTLRELEDATNEGEGA